MSWEFDILYALQSIRNPILDFIMVDITRLGDAGLFWILAALIFLLRKNTRACGVAMLLSLAISLMTCNVVLKNLVMRDRPCWIDESVTLLLTRPTDYSFPSGHTFASVVSAVTILQYNKVAGRLALLIAGLITLSRLYLFVHFPTDVLASVILAVITARVVVYFVNKYYDDIGDTIRQMRK